MALKSCKKSFKLNRKTNRCVKVKNPNNPRKSKKKSYNPFKMWGSWVGATIGFVYQAIFQDTYDIFGFGFNFSLTDINLSMGWTTIGFLIGWGIHSLIRRLK